MRSPDKFVPLGIFAVTFFILWRTLSPTLFNLDSVELTIGAKQLGLVHAPGYPLYLLVAHGFTYLPWGDVAYRVNLLSAVALAGTAPLLYLTLRHITQHPRAALSATAMFMWSYYVWTDGIIAEIYATQLWALVLTGYFVARMGRGLAPQRATWLVGASFGLALAFSPSSLIFAPALAITLLALQVPLKHCIGAGLLSLFIFGIFLLYFPLRYEANPALNMAGHYGADGTLIKEDLRSIDGVLWMVRGEQFQGLMFRNGLLPSTDQLRRFGGWFWGNWLGIGVVLGTIGVVYLAQNRRGLFTLWLVWGLPFTYFYICYGAPDRHMMLCPLYALWTIPLAYGLIELTTTLRPHYQTAVLIVLPLLFLGVNYRLVDLSQDRSVYEDAEMKMAALPSDAVVMGEWWDVLPLQYVQMIEGERDDLRLYNTFLFYGSADINPFVASLGCEQPLVLVGENVPDYPDVSATHTITRVDAPDGTLLYAWAVPNRCLSIFG